MTEHRSAPRLLLIDNTPPNPAPWVEVLAAHYQLYIARHNDSPLQLAAQHQPDLILLSLALPQSSSLDLYQQLKVSSQTAKTPVIILAASAQEEAKALTLGAADYLLKPLNTTTMLARIANQLRHYHHTQQLEQQLQQRTEALSQAQQHTVQSLGRAAKYKDEQTGLHVVRMSHYSKLLAQALGLSEHFCQLIYHAAPMHDIGKIGIPDQILKKQSKLNAQEWQVMQTHPELGAKILGDLDTDLMQMARSIALTHHEHWDGSGYPHGLIAEQIPLAGRIAAIADVFDALTSERPYKPAWPLEKALEYLQIHQGIQFDPKLIECFVELRSPLSEIVSLHRCH